jgi:hypothetical protein
MEPFDSIEKLITEHGSAAVLTIWNDKLRFEAAQMEKRFSELELQLAAAQEQVRSLQKKLEVQERLHRGILFLGGRHTGGRWQAFCPKCRIPANEAVLASRDRWAVCSAHCGWTGQPLDKPMAEIIAEIV